MFLEKSLVFIRKELDTYLRHRMGDNGNKDRVVLSTITKQNGEIAMESDKVAITLVNIEEESSRKDHKAYLRKQNGDYQKSNPELVINLFLLFLAHFSNYDEALKAISHILNFFQSRNVFDRTRYPELDTSLQRIIFDLQTMNFEQMNHLWGALGAKYIPSVLYKMRVLVVREDEISAEVAPITEVNIDTSGE